MRHDWLLLFRLRTNRHSKDRIVVTSVPYGNAVMYQRPERYASAGSGVKKYFQQQQRPGYHGVIQVARNAEPRNAGAATNASAPIGKLSKTCSFPPLLHRCRVVDKRSVKGNDEGHRDLSRVKRGHP